MDINEIASKHLGKAGDGSVVNPYVTPDSVDRTLLVPVPRHLNRTQYDLSGDEFYGFDTWHGYEVSFLTENGYPVNCVMKMNYDCSSYSIVESKSIKLYLNSFNMASMGKTVAEAISNARGLIERDLCSMLETEVEVYLHRVDDRSTHTVQPLEQYSFRCLDEEVELDDIVFSDYAENIDILEKNDDPWSDELYVWTPSLRSNCRVTNQPDWGDVYIYVKGESQPTEESLLKYIVSMRKENHFHEEICEAIYKRIYDKFNPQELFVCCLYTRRGGIDINPVRYSHSYLGNLANGLKNTMVMSEKTPRQ